MVTVESFVERHLLVNPKILFVTENCPNLNSYFYRSLGEYEYRGPNNLLQNLAKVLNINSQKGIEKDVLHFFLKRYCLIDTYINGEEWVEDTLHHEISQIYNDIVKLNPEQIVFTCIRSNIRILRLLINHERTNFPERESFLESRIVGNPDGRRVFNSPSNRSFKGFQDQFSAAIENGALSL